MVESASWCLGGELGLGTRATTMRSIRVARELDELLGGQLQDLLEALANLEQDTLTLLRSAALATGDVAITPVRDGLANGAGPDTDTEEGLADVDDDTHDLAIVLILQHLADGRHHRVQPDVIDIDVALLLERIGPFAAVLILRVFPLRSDALLEKVVVGFESEVRDGSDVVLARKRTECQHKSVFQPRSWRMSQKVLLT